MESQPKKSSRKIIRMLVKISIWLFIPLAIAAFLLTWFNHERVKGIVVNELNKYLKARIEVKDIQFSVIEKFPMASVKFIGVKATNDRDSLYNEHLLEAESVFLEFNLLDLYFEEYKIKNIEVNDAHFNMHVYKDGSDNFHFWKTGDGKGGKKFQFQLRKIKLNDVVYSYKNDATYQNYSILAKSLKASGNFTDNIQSIHVKGDLILRHIESNQVLYFKDKEAWLSTDLSVQTLQKEITIKSGELEIANMNFLLSGRMGYGETNKTLGLVASGKDILLHDFICQLPEKWRTNLEEYKSKGVVSFQLRLDGRYGGLYLPLITAGFDCRNAEIIHKETDTKLTNVQFKGTYTNGEFRTPVSQVLYLQSFSANLPYGQISGKLRLKNFLNPYLEIETSGKAKLEEVQNFFKIKNIEKVSGEMEFSVQYAGKAPAKIYQPKDFLQSNSSGFIKISNVGFSTPSFTRNFTRLNGDFNFTNNSLVINHLSGLYGNSDFILSGNLEQFFTWLFVEKEPFHLNAKLTANELYPEEWIKESDVKSNKPVQFDIPQNLDLNLDFEVKKLGFRKFVSTATSANVVIQKSQVKITNLKMNTLGGNVQGVVMIDASTGNNVLISCEANGKQIDAREAFRVFDNFGQKSLNYQHLEGKIDARVNFAALFSPELKVYPKTIVAQVQTKINNGRLKNYPPMLKLSKFIDASELQDVRFATLENQFDIRNEEIHIPEMEIRSNAVNLRISGVHKFNNVIEYYLRIRLSDLRGKRYKERLRKEEEEFGPFEEDGTGKTTLFLMMTGTIDNPVFKYDIKGVKEKIKQDLRQEKQNLKQILHEEFGWFKDKTEERREAEIMKQQEQGKFVIEWDERPKDTVSQKEKKPDQKQKAKFKVEWE